MLLRADLDQMRQTATAHAQACTELEAAGRHLGAAWEALSSTWVGQGKAEVEGRYWAARRALQERVAQLDALARWLRRRAEWFEEADLSAGIELLIAHVGVFDAVGNASGWSEPIAAETLATSADSQLGELGDA